MKMFHVEQYLKTLFTKGFFVFLIVMLFSGCITQRHSVEVGDYLLLENGKQILGREKGLTCFFFENDKRKMPFQQFLVIKYNIGYTSDIAYNVDIEGKRFKVFLYTNDELVKYYDLGQFMVTNFETDANAIGSSANFIGMSVIDEYNNDCLDDDSLFKNLITNYLKDLKQEYYNY